MSAPDLGRELLRVFRDLPFPYVPEWAVDRLVVTAPGTFATGEVDPTELYLAQGVVLELLAPAAPDLLAVSYWGHGINSYAWTVVLRRPGLRLLVQVGFGGLAPDSDQDEQLRSAFALVRDLDRRVPADLDRDVVVVVSRMRGLCSVGWRPTTLGHDERWLDAYDVADEDVLGAVDALLAPPADPDADWLDLTEGFAYAIYQTRGTGRPHFAVDTADHVVELFTDGPDRDVVITVLATSGEGFAEEGVALLRRLGWTTSVELPNPHLVVGPTEDAHRAAQALTDAVRWVWRLDARKVRTQLFELVPGEEGDLDDVDL